MTLFLRDDGCRQRGNAGAGQEAVCSTTATMAAKEMAQSAALAKARAFFPEAGDTCTLRHNGRWRSAQVLATHRTNRPPHEMRYDVALVPDGEWSPMELIKFREIFDKVDQDGSGQVR